MQTKISWFIILLKREFHRVANYVICGLMLLSLFVISQIKEPQSNVLSIVIYGPEQSEVAKKWEEVLLQENSQFLFYVVESEDVFYQDLQNGNAFCGFRMTDLVDETVKQGNQRDCITYACVRETALGQVAKETAYAAFFQVYGSYLVEQNLSQLGINEEDAFLKETKERYQQYMNSEKLFSVEYVDMQSKRVETKTAAPKGVHHTKEGIFIAFFFLQILLANMQNREKNQRLYLSLLPKKEGMLFRIFQYMAAGMPVVVSGFLGLICLDGSVEILKWLVGIIGALISGMLWAGILNGIAKKNTTYYVCSVVLVLFSVMISPVFFRASDWIPVGNGIAYSNPVGFFLSILEK